MSKFDKEYLQLCKEIFENGIDVGNRTGINTIKIPFKSLKEYKNHGPIKMKVAV